MANKIRLLLLISVHFIVVYVIFDYYDISCVFLEITGIPCLGCGMTRAVLSIVRLDFVQAFKDNVVIFFMPYIGMYILFDFKHRIHKVLLLMIVMIAIVNWLIKIILFI